MGDIIHWMTYPFLFQGRWDSDSLLSP